MWNFHSQLRTILVHLWRVWSGSETYGIRNPRYHRIQSIRKYRGKKHEKKDPLKCWESWKISISNLGDIARNRHIYRSHVWPQPAVIYSSRQLPSTVRRDSYTYSLSAVAWTRHGTFSTPPITLRSRIFLIHILHCSIRWHRSNLCSAPLNPSNPVSIIF